MTTTDLPRPAASRWMTTADLRAYAEFHYAESVAYDAQAAFWQHRADTERHGGGAVERASVRAQGYREAAIEIRREMSEILDTLNPSDPEIDDDGTLPGLAGHYAANGFEPASAEEMARTLRHRDRECYPLLTEMNAIVAGECHFAALWAWARDN